MMNHLASICSSSDSENRSGINVFIPENERTLQYERAAA